MENNQGGPGSHVDENTGPKVTLQAIEDNIAEEHYALGIQMMNGAGGQISRFHSMDTLTICVLVLKNGFTIVGTAACADPSNFDVEIGRKIARQNCINQIWPLMGYELKSQLNKMKTDNPALIDEAVTRLTAKKLGNDESFRPIDVEVLLDYVEKTRTPDHGDNA